MYCGNFHDDETYCGVPDCPNTTSSCHRRRQKARAEKGREYAPTDADWDFKPRVIVAECQPWLGNDNPHRRFDRYLDEHRRGYFRRVEEAERRRWAGEEKERRAAMKKKAEENSEGSKGCSKKGAGKVVEGLVPVGSSSAAATQMDGTQRQMQQHTYSRSGYVGQSSLGKLRVVNVNVSDDELPSAAVPHKSIFTPPPQGYETAAPPWILSSTAAEPGAGGPKAEEEETEKETFPSISAAHLPIEILNRIIKLALLSLQGPDIDHSLPTHTHISNKHHTQIDSDYEEISDLHCTLCPQLSLYNWSLVNKHWYAAATPFLYASIDLRNFALPALTVARPIPVYLPLPEGEFELLTSVREPDIIWANLDVGKRKMIERPPRAKGQDRHDYIAATMLRADDERVVAAQKRMLKADPRRAIGAIGTSPEDDYALEYEFLEDTYEYVSMFTMIGRKIKRVSPLVAWEYRKTVAPAPIKRPQSCVYPSQKHHNYFHEWNGTNQSRNEQSLSSVRQWNPASQYLLNRVLLPLLRTFNDRPDLASMVKKIQLPLLMYSWYEMTRVVLPSYYKVDKKTGVVVEAEWSDEERGPGDVYTLILDTVFKIMKCCENITAIDAPIQLDYLLHEVYVHEGSLIKAQLIQHATLYKKLLGSEKLFDFVQERYHESRSYKSGNPPTSKFKEWLATSLSADEQRQNKMYMAKQKLIASMWYDFVETVLPRLQSWSVDMTPCSMSYCNKFCRYRKTEYYDYAVACDLCLCSFKETIGDGTAVGDFLEKQTSSNGQLAKLLNLAIPVNPAAGGGGGGGLGLGQNLVHLELSVSIRDDFPANIPYLFECPYLLRSLQQMFTRMFQGDNASSVLPNFTSLSVMGPYVGILEQIPANKLRVIKYRQWARIIPLEDYLKRSFNQTRAQTDPLTSARAPTALQSLTLDTVSERFMHIKFYQIENPVPPITEALILELRTLMDIIRHTGASLEELTLRRGRLCKDTYWKTGFYERHAQWKFDPETVLLRPDDLLDNEPWPPHAPKLRSLALLSWGKGLRKWAADELQNGSFPGLQTLEYASAESEAERNALCRSFYTPEKCWAEEHGACTFCGWQGGVAGVVEMSQAKEEDARIRELGEVLGVKVGFHSGLEGFKFEFEDHPLV
ncbi:hypothetical protein DFH27DRAFT_524959 [Peziza echinospora]|nr:hypothetical protein DFH27DRAFT_524959 [Peziza echinospora]